MMHWNLTIISSNVNKFRIFSLFSCNFMKFVDFDLLYQLCMILTPEIAFSLGKILFFFLSWYLAFLRSLLQVFKTSLLAGCFRSSFRNRIKDYLYASTGCVWYMYLFWDFITFQRIARLRGFFWGNTTILWLFQCFFLLSSSRWFGSNTEFVCHSYAYTFWLWCSWIYC